MIYGWKVKKLILEMQLVLRKTKKVTSEDVTFL